MFKKLLLPVLCVASLFSATETFAMDKALKGISGEIACYGYFDSNFKSFVTFSNFDSSHSISITKIRVYHNERGLLTSLTPTQFPSDFQAYLNPFGSSELSSKGLLSDTTLRDLTFVFNFKSTDGTLAIAPQVISYVDGSKGTTASECVYTVLR